MLERNHHTALEFFSGKLSIKFCFSFIYLTGLAIASALIDISQQKPADCKDKSSGVRNRKQHLSTRQGTCVWDSKTTIVYSVMFFFKWLPLKAILQPQFLWRQIYEWTHEVLCSVLVTQPAIPQSRTNLWLVWVCLMSFNKKSGSWYQQNMK